LSIRASVDAETAARPQILSPVEQQAAWRGDALRVSRHVTRHAGVAAAVLAAVIAVALLAPALAPYDPIAQPDIIGLKNLAPSLAHPFGTDSFSRDVLSRCIYGARVSLSVAALATAIAVTFGTLYGAVAGYVGGAVDTVMMRLVDSALAIPRVLLLIAILALWNGLPLWLLVVVLGATGWFGLSRMVRAQVLALRDLDFVAAARAVGASGPRILLRHILPNVAPTIIVAATLGVGHVIILEAGLSYLGLGVQPPAASWGSIIQDGADQIGTAWWISLFPGLLIVTTTIAFNALGDALRTALDPRENAVTMAELDA
jgi:peptide/nickel transport system permease protein